jgi:hypothetical protein
LDTTTIPHTQGCQEKITKIDILNFTFEIPLFLKENGTATCLPSNKESKGMAGDSQTRYAFIKIKKYLCPKDISLPKERIKTS